MAALLATSKTRGAVRVTSSAVSRYSFGIPDYVLQTRGMWSFIIIKNMPFTRLPRKILNYK